MNDVISGRQASARIEILHRLLATIHDCELVYAADWGIAYDLQRAEQLIEREMRNTKDLSRMVSHPSAEHGDLQRPPTSPFERCLPEDE